MTTRKFKRKIIAKKSAKKGEKSAKKSPKPPRKVVFKYGEMIKQIPGWITDWATSGQASIKDYLENEIGLTFGQYQKALQHSPVEVWQHRRKEVQDRATELVISRNLNEVAEMNDAHIKASKLALAKVIEMMSKLQIEPLRDIHGKIIYDVRTRKPVYKGFKSNDLLNCTSALEKAQTIYRRAIGLPDRGEGLDQLLERCQNGYVQNNIQINIDGSKQSPKDVTPEESEVERKLNALDYDAILVLIEKKREITAEREKESKQDE